MAETTTKPILASSRQAKKQELAELRKYTRGEAEIPIKSIKNKKLKHTLKSQEQKIQDAAVKAVQSRMLLTEDVGFLEAEGMEKTYKFKQEDIQQHVDFNTQSKIFDLKLDSFGPYALDYTRNGRHMLIGGKKGHVATFEWKNGRLGTELHLGETVRDVKWLHNETMFAVAQKKYTYIYDNTGLEIHCLKKHVEANQLEFLPYHYLLASVGNSGWLKYQDTSTGQLVAELRTRIGRCDVMRQNPANATLHLGHFNGTVTLWSPNLSTPLVKMLCHKGPVKALAIDRGGYYMATSGLDGQLKLWDIRTYRPLHQYYTPTPADTLDISQRGLLAVSYGSHVAVWKDCFLEKAKSPYMTHLHASTSMRDMHFCPFEDVLAYGHNTGISSVVIPGSGEPNFDSMEANPYQTKKQRQESEVHSLLEKIQPEMISLDPNFIGNIDRAPKETLAKERRMEYEANHPQEKFLPKHKKRGKSASLRRYLRKQSNVRDATREAVKNKLEKAKRERQKRKNGESDPKWTALDMFQSKKMN